MNLYDNIVYLANLKNLTIKEIEFRAGLSNGSIRRWNEIDPGISKVGAVANILGTSVESIVYGVNTKNQNSALHTLNRSGTLTRIQSGFPDSSFGITDFIDGYDKIRYTYNFMSSENTFIDMKTVFIFDRFTDSSLLQYDMTDIKNNNLIALVYNYNFNKYYIGRLKYAQGVMSPIFLPFDNSAPNLIVDSNMTVLISICRFIVAQR
jgi:hypothetical protein